MFRLITTSVIEERILARASDKRSMTDLVVEAGQFHKSAQDASDKAMMMEELMREYNRENNSGGGGGGEGEEEGAVRENVVPDDDEINDMMAIDATELRLYQAMDVSLEAARVAGYTRRGLAAPPKLMSAGDAPAWMKEGDSWDRKHSQLFVINRAYDDDTSGNDGGSGSGESVLQLGEEYSLAAAAAAAAALEEGEMKRKRKVVLYDDGLTETQFLNLVEEQTDEVEAEAEAARVTKKSVAVAAAAARAIAASTSSSASSSSHIQSSTAAAAGRGAGAGAGVVPHRVLSPYEVDLTIDVIKALEKAVNEDGLLLNALFTSLPDRQIYPDYYRLITEPISLKAIAKRLKANRASVIPKDQATARSLSQNFDLLVKNASVYNGEGHMVHIMSMTLRKDFHRHMRRKLPDWPVTIAEDGSVSTGGSDGPSPSFVPLPSSAVIATSSVTATASGGTRTILKLKFSGAGSSSSNISGGSGAVSIKRKAAATTSDAITSAATTALVSSGNNSSNMIIKRNKPNVL